MTEKIQKISLIIPTYNGGYIVGQTIETTLNQAYQNFKIIVFSDDYAAQKANMLRSKYR